MIFPNGESVRRYAGSSYTPTPPQVYHSNGWCRAKSATFQILEQIIHIYLFLQALWNEVFLQNRRLFRKKLYLCQQEIIMSL